MPTNEFPQQVFKVKIFDGKPRVVRANIISRRGSWFEFDNGRRRWKQNGRTCWESTAMDALRTFVNACCRMLTWDCMSDRHEQCRRDIVSALDEAADWGRLLGQLETAVQMNRERQRDTEQEPIGPHDAVTLRHEDAADGS